MRKDRANRKGMHPADENPLNAAVAARDRDAIRMVQAAVDRKEVMLAFQPVVPATNPGQPAFHEALIRVLDETQRIIPAGDFIEAIETTELGRKIDCLALELGLAELHAVPGLRLSVNMSARSIGYPQWTRVLHRGLAQDPTIGERLILEITEASAMVVPDMVAVFMRELQDQGLAFALDDFGAGFTSFRYLKDFYFDILKIDGQFIRGIAANRDNQCLTKALLGIAHHFEMFAVAESVENDRDAAYLARIGMDCLQGYHFGAPVVHPPWRQDSRDRRRA
ncbi:EAL domain-containing protein [Albidovulum sp.]|uniref:EAL domain-containing protein n=2 Tax=Albidovulum sp. TaxID=1872424 RepID=UPI001DF0EE24|nr:EAL domain-containing protein [Paracoccaceae bacterium]MCC0045815.1 EAL domain-containing protein [Defluviimonas sp.]HRV61632.1 EAL domain-containing protein [Albidovulum sp.]MCB2118920.1 EAL domain-containing protein [Paracoccaceae bacterium]MCB2121485.1 EAL domain-containing protein [Paracoccaceae bacterium]